MFHWLCDPSPPPYHLYGLHVYSEALEAGGGVFQWPDHLCKPTTEQDAGDRTQPETEKDEKATVLQRVSLVLPLVLCGNASEQSAQNLIKILYRTGPPSETVSFLLWYSSKTGQCQKDGSQGLNFNLIGDIRKSPVPGNEVRAVCGPRDWLEKREVKQLYTWHMVNFPCFNCRTQEMLTQGKSLDYFGKGMKEFRVRGRGRERAIYAPFHYVFG